MNRVLRALLSLVLIAAGIFGLFTGINGVKDALNIKDYKEADAEHGKAQINDELLPVGIRYFCLLAFNLFQ